MQFKHILKETLEEQQRQKSIQQDEFRRRGLQEEQELLNQNVRQLEAHEQQQRIRQKERQRELSEAYDRSIVNKKLEQDHRRMKNVQDDFDQVQQAQQYQEFMRQQKQQQQLAMKQMQDVEMDNQNRKKQRQLEMQQQERYQEQQNQEIANIKGIQKQQQYKDYFKSVTEHQEKLQMQFADKFSNRNKQMEIDNHINRGIEDQQRRNEYQLQQRAIQQTQNKQEMKEALERQIREKEQNKLYIHSQEWPQQYDQSRKRDDQQRYQDILNQQVQIKSTGFNDSQFHQRRIDPAIHNPILNPIPANNQNPYLNTRSPMGQYGNQVLKLY